MKSVQVVGMVLAALAVMGMSACSPGLYRRKVTASVTGPSSIRVGETAQLSITLTFSDGTSNLLQPSQASSVEVQSSNPSVLTVTGDGQIRGISPGTATVTVTPSVTSVGNNNRTPGTLAIVVIP